ncbi:izumo sperm-egg fusion protein 1 [Brachionichthys hirsutus]|uniref:izumo sperm-egg fusion protein 1 n=1 Tax=Brachionichthys hirsutus TaxID=412623 RepID=UPI00360435B4
MERILVLMFLLCIVPAAKACLQCDRRLRVLHEDFILSAPSVADQIALKKISDHTYVTYKDTSRERKGVIDPTTLYRARTEYQSEFDRFSKTQHTGSVAFQAVQIMGKGRDILEKHLDNFTRDGLCPNKCGLLKRRVIDCFSCRYKMYICPSPTGQQDCGVFAVQAEEGGQAVLNCFLPWHRLLFGKRDYHYSWAAGVPGTKKLNESSFNVLVVTEDSSVVLNQLQADEQGTYRCSLQDPNGVVFYQVAFLLTVDLLPDPTPRPVITLPPLPSDNKYSPFRSIEGLMVPAMSVVTALILAASVGLTVVSGLMINRRMAVKEQRNREAEANAQNTV